MMFVKTLFVLVQLFNVAAGINFLNNFEFRSPQVVPNSAENMLEEMEAQLPNERLRPGVLNILTAYALDAFLLNETMINLDYFCQKLDYHLVESNSKIQAIGNEIDSTDAYWLTRLVETDYEKKRRRAHVQELKKELKSLKAKQDFFNKLPNHSFMKGVFSIAFRLIRPSFLIMGIERIDTRTCKPIGPLWKLLSLALELFIQSDYTNELFRSNFRMLSILSLLSNTNQGVVDRILGHLPVVQKSREDFEQSLITDFEESLRR